MNLAITLLALALTVGLVGCSSETPETQKLYTDAKMMWDEVNRGFTLPKGAERSTLMNKIIDEKWDSLIVSDLTDYVKKAPGGKFSKEAKALLDSAQASDKLRMITQVRPFLKQAMQQNAATKDTTQPAQQQGEPGGGQ